MKVSIEDYNFLDSFDAICEHSIDEHGKYKLNLFTLKVNANEFNISYLEEKLVDPLIEFSLSRNTKEEYKGKSGTLSRKAREKFREYLKNKGELGELLLFCLLESHLKAPKILSKLELKTSTSHYVNGSDGVHFLKLANGNYQLIFGESKTIVDLTTALTDAFSSIKDFKLELNAKKEKKSGIGYEKSLISDHLTKETFSDDEKEFLKKIIYPHKDNDFEVDDAFGIFVCYEILISDDDKMLPNDQFRAKIQKQVKDQIEDKLEHVLKKITEFKLFGHNFYIYILPITDLDKNRASITQSITA
jgi:hypothetical protein